MQGNFHGACGFVGLGLVILCLSGILLSGAGCNLAGIAPPPPSNHSTQGLRVVDINDLPSEARAALQLIKTGGPFSYEKDGAVFHNYEELLPEQPDGYYHEFTVTTPGSKDRGARRIISGQKGEYYYTGDHYSSFSLISERHG